MYACEFMKYENCKMIGKIIINKKMRHLLCYFKCINNVSAISLFQIARLRTFSSG